MGHRVTQGIAQRLAAGLSLASAIAACSERTKPSDESVVALTITTGTGDEGLCSAVVVAPRVVLTAAHCVAPQAVGQGAKLRVFLGDDLNDADQKNDSSNFVAITKTAFDSKFDLDLIRRGHDVGFAQTDRPLPGKPVPLDLSAPVASKLRFVGFGADSKRGQRRHGEARLEESDPKFLKLGEGATPCLGDSGGPVFAADGRLVGLVSHTNGECGPGTLVTNLAAYRELIEARVAELGR